LDINEATPTGKVIELEDDSEKTVAYFEVRVNMGGVYDQVAIGLATS
jgi:hypothetical protein